MVATMPVDGIRRAQVRTDHDRGPAGGPDLVGHLVRTTPCGCVADVERDGRALRRECAGERRADATPAPVIRTTRWARSSSIEQSIGRPARIGSASIHAVSAPPPRPRGPRDLLTAFGGGLSANFWQLWASTAAANLADGISLIAIPLIAVG